MNSVELRKAFLSFFKERDHQVIQSSSLVPDEKVELTGTKRVLFTTAGMHPLIPYLLGEPHPAGKRLVSVQKCLRTDDIEEVGDAVHNTFFEMLGNWSLGDYWKEEAIAWSWEFLTRVMGLEKNRLVVSVFGGDDLVPPDELSYQVWSKIGLSKERIFKYGRDKNWWGPIGSFGPCGPDTEIFYDLTPTAEIADPASNPSRFIEVWNNVFMEYQVDNKGNLNKLVQKNVDTGMGLERALMVLGGVDSIYETDVFTNLVTEIKNLAAVEDMRSIRIVADHLRASVFLLSDGVIPSNLERGYILRRLIRRSIRHLFQLKVTDNCLAKLAEVVINDYSLEYPNLKSTRNFIITELNNEGRKFESALRRGLKQFDKIEGNISGKAAFDLYQNFGFPIELTTELAKERSKTVDVSEFYRLLKEHQKISKSESRQASGGLAAHSKLAIAGHTATHLLHQALRDVLGKNVHQMGSYITTEKIRFDFNFDRKLTAEELLKIEKIVNQKIKENLKVERLFVRKEEADRLGAIGLFKEKYGDLVSIYKIGDYSLEYCGGPHVEWTGELQGFKIVKEEGIGTGKRRIYAKVGK